MAYPAVADNSLRKSTVYSEDSILHNSLTQSAKNYKTVILPQMDSVDEVSAPTSGKRCCYFQRWTVYDHLTYFSCLSMASYLGVVCRIYLSELSHWDGVPLFVSMYSQVVGTMVMGFTVAHKAVLGKHHVFIYQAITTGLCGSITTFSSWNLEAMNSLLQTGYDPPDDVARVFGWATTLLLGLGMSSGALGMGKHLAFLSPWSDGRVHSRQATNGVVESSESSGCRVRCPGDKCRALLCLCLWLALSVLMVTGTGPVLDRWDLTFSILFAALGTYLRWHLAPLNTAILSFKLGTFCVNLLGSWLLGGVLILQEVYSTGWTHSVLVGIGTGFCGCLTTVSTFAVELSSLKLRHAYLYAFTSILAAQVGLLLIIGPVQWTAES